MLSILALLSLLSSSLQQPAPNVLVVVADDLGLDLVGAYGLAPNPPCTPTLEALAGQGMLFRDAWVTPYCSPSRAALLTGRHGFRTGVGQPIGAVLGLEERTIAEALRNSTAGYSTAALGKWHLAGGSAADPLHPNHSGFEHFAGTLAGSVPDYSAWTKVTNGLSAPTEVYATVDTTEDALALVATLPEPWFLYVCYHAPHTPLHAPPAALCQDEAACPKAFCTDLGPGSTNAERLKAMVEVLDGQLGRLVEAVDLDDTYLFFLGDNGTAALGVEPPFAPDEAKGTVHQGGVNVPLIVLGPDVVAGETTAPVGVTDLMATVGELTRTGVGAEDSVSFAPTLFDPSRRSRSTVYTETFTPNGSPLPIDRHDYAMRDERYKLLVQYNQPDELYDLSTDPFEDHDLLPAATSQIQSVYERLQAEVQVLHEGLEILGTVDALPLSAGGVQQLILAAGNEAASDGYWVLGTSSGTTPGILLQGSVLPLVLDAYLELSVTGANELPFTSTVGAFNDQGAALASITLPSGGGLALVGTTLHHAYIRFDPATGAIASISPPEALHLLP